MKKNNFLIALFFLFSSSLSAQEITAPENLNPTHFSNIAQLQILNKTTAKTTLVEIRTGQEVDLGSIAVSVRKCWQAPLDQKPESKILVEVSEIKIEKNGEEILRQKTRIFYGWLFASSPSISGLEHPIYDIVAMGCKNK